MAVTYTFENIVINGVDTSKTYNDSTLPIRWFTKRIICNGEDKLHKDADVLITNNNIITSWGTAWCEEFLEKVMPDLDKSNYCVTSKGRITIDGVVRGIVLEFEKPATFYYYVEEDDTVAGGWVPYESDTVTNVSHVSMEFIPTALGPGYETLEITFNRQATTKRVIKTDMYELGLADLRITIKGRVY